jgi:hypothetical protein
VLAVCIRNASYSLFGSEFGVPTEPYAADRRNVATHGFILALFCGAALLAMWCDVRLGERGPTALSRIVLHAIIALLLLRVARVAVDVAIDPGEMVQTVLVLFGIFLPALVYVMLASIWVLRLVRSVLPR